MSRKDTRVDAYIAKSADFAKPILLHIRRLVHKACPDVQEKMKWSFPHFDHHGMMCSMAAFKEHCAFGFWKATMMKESATFAKAGRNAMGHLGRISSLDQLPSDRKLTTYIKEAGKLNEAGVKRLTRSKPESKKVVRVPNFFRSELKKNKAALKTFEGFSQSHRREYIAWIVEAKTKETRAKRVATAIDWMGEGRSRNWKHMTK